MNLKWSNQASSDLGRLYEFLAAVNPDAAVRVVQSLTNAPMRLIEHPRLGRRLSEFEPRDVRKLIMGEYELRYEIQESVIYLLRFWHTRENR